MENNLEKEYQKEYLDNEKFMDQEASLELLNENLKGFKKKNGKYNIPFQLLINIIQANVPDAEVKLA